MKEYRPKWGQGIPESILNDPHTVIVYDAQWAEEQQIEKFRFKLIQQQRKEMMTHSGGSSYWQKEVPTFPIELLYAD